MQQKKPMVPSIIPFFSFSACLLPGVLVVGLAAISSSCGGANGTGNHSSTSDGGANNNTSALCGNGQVEGAEQCDDGPDNSDSRPDACRTDCREAHCGDGVADTGEDCDEGAQNSDVVPDACRSDCSQPRCGDGVVDLAHGEGCDCGDDSGLLPSRCIMENSDDDRASCRPGCVPAGCGDGLLTGQELCDGTHLGDFRCQDFGFYAGQIACTSACSYDLSGCSEFCLDGIVNGDELCDTAPPVGPGQSCFHYGFDRGHLGCSDYCTPAFSNCGYIGWRFVPTGIHGQLRDIWGRAADDIYVVGTADAMSANGVVLH